MVVTRIKEKKPFGRRLRFVVLSNQTPTPFCVTDQVFYKQATGRLSNCVPSYVHHL